MMIWEGMHFFPKLPLKTRNAYTYQGMLWYVKLLNDTLSNVQTHTTDNTCNNTCRKYSKYIFFHLNFTFFFFDEIPKSYNFYVISGIRSIYNCRISFHGKIWKWKEHTDVAMVVCVFLILWDIPCVNLI